MRKFFNIFFVIICWLSVVCEVNSQIMPPDFLCVKGDSLKWSNVNNPCGPFENIYIYYSEDENGPFLLLDSVFDQNLDFYEHLNPSDKTYFYYLESNHNCPGFTVIQSDTLNNRLPAITDIESITVNGNDVFIEWEQNPSPETAGYIIYRFSASAGIFPIDTVYNSLNYTDLTANPEEQSETYYVRAFDLCGNTGLIVNPHRTLFLSGNVEECEQKIELEWNPYIGWDGGIEKHEVWIGEDGAVPVMVDEILGSDSSYIVQNVVDGREYCVYIRAVSEGSGAVSVTNQFCITGDVIDPVRELEIKNLDVLASGDIEVTWIWNTNAIIQKADIMVGPNGSGSSQAYPFSFSSPLSRENQFTYTTSPSDVSRLLSFNVSTVDGCDSSETSSPGNPILLSISSGGLTNFLSWSPLSISNVEVLSYEIFKIENGNQIMVGQVDSNILEFSETLNPVDVSTEPNCYFVRAISEFTFPDGSVESIRSHSNQVCQSQSAKIWMPNAFAPRGRNQVFKPIIAYGVPKDYKMIIYNRWGEVIFQSEEIQSGWNGKIGIRDAPSGVYTYQVKLVNQDDSAESLSGSVMLVR